MKRMNKKGSVQDVVLIMVVIFVFSLVTIISFKVQNELNTKFQASDQFDDHGKNAMGNINNIYSGVLDNSALFLVVGLSIGAIALAGLVRIHPIFLALFIIVWLIIIFLCAALSNVYQSIAANPSMADVATRLVFTGHIMSLLPWLVAIIGGLIAMVMYKNYKMVSDF